MTPLRQRMTEDMQLRNLSTQRRGSSGAAMFEFLEFFAGGGTTARGLASPDDAGLPNNSTRRRRPATRRIGVANTFELVTLPR
jgi:hypothetical protein